MECFKFCLSEYQKEELKFVFDLFGPKNGKITIESARNLLMKLEETSERQQFLTNPINMTSNYELKSPESPQNARITPFLNIKSISCFPNGIRECTFDEFASIYEGLMSEKSLDNILLNVFALFDIKKTGLIDSKDLQKVADILGESIQNEEESKRLLMAISPKYQNGITFKEFREFFINDIKNDENKS